MCFFDNQEKKAIGNTMRNIKLHSKFKNQTKSKLKYGMFQTL